MCLRHILSFADLSSCRSSFLNFCALSTYCLVSPLWRISSHVGWVFLTHVPTWYVRFKNTSTRTSKLLGVIPGGERLGSLNRHYYRIDVYAKVDAFMCEKGGCCPAWVKVLWVWGKASSIECSLRESMDGHITTTLGPPVKGKVIDILVSPK